MTSVPEQIRITLDYIEILDSKDIDTYGEFRFEFTVGIPERGVEAVTRIPDPDARPLSISEHPAMNRITLDTTLFEGAVQPEDTLVIAATGVDVDRLSRNDPLRSYRRVFLAPAAGWIGAYTPWDEGTAQVRDPEQLGDWRFAYRIERVDSPVPAR